MNLTLYNQCRSGPSYRVRIGLALKGAPYLYVPIDLAAGEQRSAEHLARNPQGLAPALDVDGRMLTQSSAILEWLEETFPAPPLLPSTPLDRALVRAMAAVVGSDMQPLNNLRVQKHLRKALEVDRTGVDAWIHRWLEEGFSALEVLVERHGGRFAFGDSPSMADVYLIPQAATAAKAGFSLDGFPRLAAVVAHATEHPAFQAASPARQPDFR